MEDTFIDNYYVYSYLDPRKPGNYDYGEYHFDFEPFYIGKGLRLRYKNHLNKNSKSTNIILKNKINKIKNMGLNSIVLKLKENISEKSAFDFEIKLIKIIKKKSEGGPLLNIIDGGSGGPIMKGKDNPMYGKKRPDVSEKMKKNNPMDNFESRKKAADSKRGKKNIKLSNYIKDLGKTHLFYNEDFQKKAADSKRGKKRPGHSLKMSGENNPNYGKPRSDETKRKISETKKNKYIIKLSQE